MTESNYIMTISVPAEIASKTVSSSILQCMVLNGHVNNGVVKAHIGKVEDA